MSELAVQNYLTRFDSTDSFPAWLASGSIPDLSLGHSVQYRVSLANCIDDVREAQRLRFNVFGAEYSASFSSNSLGIDSDLFDQYCDHLIVRCTQTHEVVGTYRVLLPLQAKRIGQYYSQGEFFMTRLQRQIPDLVELGRSCVHPDHRSGVVIMMLWSGIARYMRHHGCNHLIGCASVSMRDGGSLAATLWDSFRESVMVDPILEAFPKHPLPLQDIDRAASVVIPPLIRGYLKIGAQVCGEPNWDPDFNTADFLMLLDMAAMDPRYARHFGVI